MEEWKPTHDDKYEVSNLGNVRNKRTNRLLVLQDIHGYQRVKIARKDCRVHRLVANAFLPNPLSKPQVNHKALPMTSACQHFEKALGTVWGAIKNSDRNENYKWNGYKITRLTREQFEEEAEKAKFPSEPFLGPTILEGLEAMPKKLNAHFPSIPVST